MALDDLADDVKEEVKGLDDEEAESLAKRIVLLREIILNVDKRVEVLEREVESMKSESVDEDGGGFLEDESEDYSWE